MRVIHWHCRLKLHSKMLALQAVLRQASLDISSFSPCTGMYWFNEQTTKGSLIRWWPASSYTGQHALVSVRLIIQTPSGWMGSSHAGSRYTDEPVLNVWEKIPLFCRIWRRKCRGSHVKVGLKRRPTWILLPPLSGLLHFNIKIFF